MNMNIIFACCSIYRIYISHIYILIYEESTEPLQEADGAERGLTNILYI